ncbi:MAG: TlpA family protein disulfide reductase [Acidobacteria bacterium]|nr:TlpA family protein disulfide reductase [Acidobacteriota bacterium]
MPRSSRGVVLFFLAGLAGCGPGGGPDEALPGPRVGSGNPGAPDPVVTPATAPEVLAAVRGGGGRATLVNVWATWCRPCLEELPDILEVRGRLRDRGMEVILVSGDFPGESAAVVGFLREQGVDFPSFIRAGDDMEFIDGLSPEWSGALPASFLYGADGRQVEFWEGKITAAELERKVVRVLESS